MPTARKHSKDLRKGRYSVSNGIYLATFVTKNRKTIFKDLYLARAVVRCLNKSPYADTLAFVVMPDHVHWLLQLRSSKTLSQVIQATKAISSRNINRRSDQKGSIWQPGFHDHALRNEEALKEIGRYIVANPLRAKLVSRIGEYSHWDAVWIQDSRRVVAPTTNKNAVAAKTHHE